MTMSVSSETFVPTGQHDDHILSCRISFPSFRGKLYCFTGLKTEKIHTMTCALYSYCFRMKLLNSVRVNSVLICT